MSTDYRIITDSLGNKGRDTNYDGILSSNEIDSRASGIGLGADKIKKDDSWVKSAYGVDKRTHIQGLMRGDWAGDIDDTNNAMDDLLKSDKFNNGRIPDVSMVENVVKTFDGDIIIRNDNQQTGVKGIIEETVLSDTFFSEKNTMAIQDTIRYGVYKVTNLVIGYQSSQELYIIMRSILLQNANFKITQEKLFDEIRKLNKLVVDYSVKEVSSNVQQYQGYIKEIEKMPTPIDRPDYNDHTTRNKGYNTTPHMYTPK